MLFDRGMVWHILDKALPSKASEKGGSRVRRFTFETVRLDITCLTLCLVKRDALESTVEFYCERPKQPKGW